MSSGETAGAKTELSFFQKNVVPPILRVQDLAANGFFVRKLPASELHERWQVCVCVCITAHRHRNRRRLSVTAPLSASVCVCWPLSLCHTHKTRRIHSHTDTHTHQQTHAQHPLPLH
jgi:hypothetical protein